MQFNKILVTTDFSDDSIVAFEFTAYQAKMEGSQIALLTVVTDWIVPASLYEYVPDPAQIDRYRKEIKDSAEKNIKALAAKHFHGQKVVTEVIMSEKPVAQEITDYAKKNSYNVIVISSHGRGAVGNLLLGSVVSKVIKLAHCPVLVIPKKQSK